MSFGHLDVSKEKEKTVLPVFRKENETEQQQFNQFVPQLDRLMSAETKAHKYFAGYTRQDLEERARLKENIQSTSWMHNQYMLPYENFNGIMNTYPKVFKTKSLSYSEIEKRKDKFRHKERYQAGVHRSLEQLHKAYDEAPIKMARDVIVKHGHTNENDGNPNDYTEISRDFATYASMYKGLPGYENLEERATEVISRAVSGIKIEASAFSILREVQDTSLDEFVYHDEYEFVQNLPRKLAKLRALSHAGAIRGDMKLLQQEGGIGDMNMLIIDEKIRMLEEIKEDYESRVAMMQSPYYVLLEETDFTKLSQKELDKLRLSSDEKELRTYIDTMKKRKKLSKFGMGTEMADFAKQAQKDVHKEEKARTKKAVSELESGLKKFAKSHKLKLTPGVERAGALAQYMKSVYGDGSILEMNNYLETVLNPAHKTRNTLYSEKERQKLLLLSEDMVMASNMAMSLLNRTKAQQIADETFEIAQAQTAPKELSARDRKRIKADRSDFATADMNQDMTFVYQMSTEEKKLTSGRSYMQSVTQLMRERDDVTLARLVENFNAAKKAKGISDEARGEFKTAETAAQKAEKEARVGSYIAHMGFEVNERELDEQARTEREKAVEAQKKMDAELLTSEDPLSEFTYAVLDDRKTAIQREQDDRQHIVRKDFMGHKRRANAAKFAKSSVKDEKMDKAVEQDLENLLTNVRLDQMLSRDKLELEEPLASTVKGYAIFIKINEPLIMEYKMHMEENREIIDFLETDKTADHTAEITRLKEEILALGKQREAISAFVLLYKAIIPSAKQYIDYMERLKSVRLAKKIIASDPAGTYKTKMMEELNKQDKEYRDLVEVSLLSFIRTLSNGFTKGINIEQNQILFDCAQTYDRIMAVKGDKYAADSAHAIMDEMRDKLREYGRTAV